MKIKYQTKISLLLFIGVGVALFQLYWLVLAPHESAASENFSANEFSLNYSTALKLLPAKAMLVQKILVDFENNGNSSVALVYEVPLNAYPTEAGHRTTCGLMILTYQSGKRWVVIHHEPAGNGSPTGMELDILKNPNHSNSLFVQSYYSGAGTTSSWSLFTPVQGKLVIHERWPVLEKVLKARNYVFQGYNSSSVFDSSFVEESVPGYSKEASRCCADKPTLLIRYRFTGTSIEAVSVKEIELSDCRIKQSDFKNEAWVKPGPISEDDAKAFIFRWMKLSEDNLNFFVIMSFYGEEVDFYKFGKNKKTLVAADKKTYFEKWPMRIYAIEEIMLFPGDNDGEKKAEVKFRYSLSNRNKTITGSAKALLLIQKQKDRVFIVSEKGEVLKK